MQYKTHRLGGMCAGAVTAAAIYGDKYSFISSNEYLIPATFTLIAAGAIGSLIPDIDHSNSYVSRRNPILAALVKLLLDFSKLVTNILLFFCFWISKKRKREILSGMEHRGIFHTILMTLAIYLLFGIIANILPTYGELIQIGITVGYLSHILVDMLTKSGVMLLYPIVTKKFHWPFIRLTTGKHEAVATLIILAISIPSIIYFIN